MGVIVVRIGTEAYGELILWAKVHHKAFYHDANTLTVWF